LSTVLPLRLDEMGGGLEERRGLSQQGRWSAVLQIEGQGGGRELGGILWRAGSSGTVA
jgi:hypothetical protein